MVEVVEEEVEVEVVLEVVEEVEVERLAGSLLDLCHWARDPRAGPIPPSECPPLVWPPESPPKPT